MTLAVSLISVYVRSLASKSASSRVPVITNENATAGLKDMPGSSGLGGGKEGGGGDGGDSGGGEGGGEGGDEGGGGEGGGAMLGGDMLGDTAGERSWVRLRAGRVEERTPIPSVHASHELICSGLW